VWNTTRMLGVVFEVIQPDLEINRRHAATLLIPPQGAVCEPLRAVLWRDWGKFWQRHCGRTRPGLWCWAQGFLHRAAMCYSKPEYLTIQRPMSRELVFS
jgi:hypothetical protein